jgi:hypothetical protein
MCGRPALVVDTGRNDEPCELKKFRQSSYTADQSWRSDNGLPGREQRIGYRINDPFG